MLPVKTSPEDAQAVVAYLRTKPTGATMLEAKATLEGRILDGRKISAYKYWELIDDAEGKLKLTPRGRELAMSNGKSESVYRKVIRGSRAYRTAVEWIYHQKRSEVLSEDLAAHWHEHLRDEVGTDADATIRGQVACFFQLAAAAGLGDYVLGRGNASTRLEVNRAVVEEFVTGQVAELDQEVETDQEEANKGLPSEPSEPGLEKRIEREDVDPPKPAPNKPERKETRVFISHGKNTSIVDQVKTMLDVTKLDYEVAVDTETTAIPVPDKVLSAMRRCTAAIICVTADADTQRDTGSFVINENVLIEIGTAFVLYDKKVVLVWDRRLTVPSNLQGLYRCEFEGDELSWSAGMKLMKALGEFQA